MPRPETFEERATLMRVGPVVRRVRLARLAAVAASMLAVATPAAAQYRPRPVNEAPPSETFLVEGSFGLWNPSPHLSFASESLGIVGTNINLVQDLALKKSRVTAFNVAVRPARKHKFRFQLVPFDYKQTTTLRRDIVFNGQRYPVGQSVTSQLNWKATRISYEYDFITMSRGFGGLILDLKQTHASVTLRGDQTNEFTRLRAYIPAVGGIARVYVSPTVSVTGELSGMKLPAGTFSDSRGHYTELDIYGTYNVTPRVGAQLGYRSFDMEAQVDQDAGAFTLKGLYFGVVIRH